MEHLENSGPHGGQSSLAQSAKSSTDRDQGDNLPSNSLLPLSEHVDRGPTTGVKPTRPVMDDRVPGADHDCSRCRLALLITV